MANTKSAAKRARQSEKRRIRNRMIRTRMRSSVKQARLALGSGDTEAAEAAVREAGSELDRAAQKGVIHRNVASRTKARLAKHLNSLA